MVRCLAPNRLFFLLKLADSLCHGTHRAKGTPGSWFKKDHNDEAN